MMESRRAISPLILSLVIVSGIRAMAAITRRVAAMMKNHTVITLLILILAIVSGIRAMAAITRRVVAMMESRRAITLLILILAIVSGIRAMAVTLTTSRRAIVMKAGTQTTSGQVIMNLKAVRTPAMHRMIASMNPQTLRNDSNIESYQAHLKRLNRSLLKLSYISQTISIIYIYSSRLI
jgi:membrane-associated HD superfamily phosphohydrolase